MFFDCQRCGQCCEGKGGIIVSPKDLVRLCAFLDLSPDDFEQQWGERVGNKLRIRTGTDGHCVFFKQGIGCGIHEGKPDVCRAWPFFRGNLIDNVSFALAKEYCPGIPKDLSFVAFVQEGKEYLEEHGLVAENHKQAANALSVHDIMDTEKNS